MRFAAFLGCCLSDVVVAVAVVEEESRGEEMECFPIGDLTLTVADFAADDAD